MARAADNFFNPRRNFEIEVNAAGLYDYVKRFQLGYFPAGSLPNGTIAININVDEFASQVICVQDRATGAISKVNAGDITLMPRGESIDTSGNYFSEPLTIVGAAFTKLSDNNYSSNGSTGYMQKNSGLFLTIPKKTVLCELEIYDYVSGNIVFYDGYTPSNAYDLNGFPITQSTYLNSNGIKKFYYKSTWLTPYGYIFLYSNNFNGKVKNFSMKTVEFSKFRDITDLTNAPTIQPFQVHNFEKYLIPGDFSASFASALNYSTAITRFLRKYELSCLEYSRTFAQYLQNYFYIACVNNNPQSTTFLFQKPQALVNYYNALEDNDLITNTLQIWSSIFHAGIDKSSAIYNYFSILYALPLPGAPTPLAITGKPYVGSLASAEDQNLSVEIVERENRDMTHSNINLPASEAWTLVIVANLNGFPASGYINFEMGGVSAYDGLAITTGGIFVFIDKDGNPTTFTTSFNPWWGRTAIIHLQYTPTTGSPQGTFKLYINGELLETRAGYGATMVNRLFNSNVSVQPSGKYYLRRIAQGQTPNDTQVLNEATALRAIFPEYPSVVIGSQEWTVENCNQVTTALGYTIPEVTNNAAWAALTTPGWCYINNDPALGTVYGKLYNFYASEKIYNDAIAYNLTAPENRKIKFLLPSISDFNILDSNLGGYSISGGKLKKAGLTYWNSPNSAATNSSRFNAIGAGYRINTGAFSSFKTAAYFRTLTLTKFCLYNSSAFTQDNIFLNHGFSLRFTKK